MNERDTEQHAALEALGEIAEKTGVTMKAKTMPECPCDQLSKCELLIKQLTARVKYLKEENKKLRGLILNEIQELAQEE
jgi:hypothetical protein